VGLQGFKSVSAPQAPSGPCIISLFLIRETGFVKKELIKTFEKENIEKCLFSCSGDIESVQETQNTVSWRRRRQWSAVSGMRLGDRAYCLQRAGRGCKLGHIMAQEAVAPGQASGAETNPTRQPCSCGSSFSVFLYLLSLSITCSGDIYI
jgi:hypothetical protein